MPRIQIKVNGEARTVDVDADMPLLWILRNLIGLTGTKYGCGEALEACRQRRLLRAEDRGLRIESWERRELR